METSGFPAWRAWSSNSAHPLNNTFLYLCLCCMSSTAGRGYVNRFLSQHAWQCATNQTLEHFTAAHPYLDVCIMPSPSPEWESKGPVHLTFNPVCSLLCFHRKHWPPVFPFPSLTVASHACHFLSQGRIWIRHKHHTLNCRILGILINLSVFHFP